jgi:hypothetical protein
VAPGRRIALDGRRRSRVRHRDGGPLYDLLPGRLGGAGGTGKGTARRHGFRVRCYDRHNHDGFLRSARARLRETAPRRDWRRVPVAPGRRMALRAPVTLTLYRQNDELLLLTLPLRRQAAALRKQRENRRMSMLRAPHDGRRLCGANLAAHIGARPFRSAVPRHRICPRISKGGEPAAAAPCRGWQRMVPRSISLRSMVYLTSFDGLGFGVWGVAFE